MSMKLIFGPITNPNTNECKAIEVKGPALNYADLITNGVIILTGVTAVTVGVTRLVNAAFASGAKAYDEAEYNVLSELGLVSDL